MIASTSMAIPTVAVVYGDKSYGILGDMMGQCQFLLQIECMKPQQFVDELKKMVENAWNNREYMVKTLRKQAVIARDQAFSMED